MFDEKFHGFCSEFYIVEKSIEVVVTLKNGETEHLKIEALKDVRSDVYSTTAYRLEHLNLQPTYPQSNGAYDRPPEDFRIWVSYELPWTRRDSADAAIRQALGFLHERCEE